MQGCRIQQRSGWSRRVSDWAIRDARAGSPLSPMQAFPLVGRTSHSRRARTPATGRRLSASNCTKLICAFLARTRHRSCLCHMPSLLSSISTHHRVWKAHHSKTRFTQRSTCASAMARTVRSTYCRTVLAASTIRVLCCNIAIRPPTMKARALLTRPRRMSCNSTSTALVAESWTGLSCSGAPIATVSLVALNGACVNGSTSFCVTAANGVSQTITPSGTPSSSATSTVTATASVTAAVTSTSTVSRSVNPSPTASQTAAPNAMPRADVGAIVGATLGVLAAFVFFGVIVLRRRGYLTSMPTMAWLRYGTIPADERTGLSSGLVNPASSVSRPKTRAVYNVTVI